MYPAGSPAGNPANFQKLSSKNRVQGGGQGGLRPLSPGFHFTFSKVSLEISSWIPSSIPSSIPAIIAQTP